MKTFYILLFSFVLAQSVNAQQKPKINIWDPPVQKNIRNLDVGDSVPDFKLAKIYNDKRKTASMTDFKDQLVIFDFGNMFCPGCVAALPHMNALEKQFAGRLRIFWVTPEYEADIARFWQRKNNEYTKGNDLATIVEDSTVRAYFKHKSWPHEAWVYKGKVIALTTAQYVDENNINRVLSGEAVNWPVKNDFYVFDTAKEAMFRVNKAGAGKVPVLKYAAISGYKEGVNSEGFGGSGIVRDSASKTIRAYALNSPVYTIYEMYWRKSIKTAELVKPAGLTPNQVIWEVKDKWKYFYDAKQAYLADWVSKYGICFESLNKNTGQTDEQVAKTVIRDLDALLGLHVRWEKRKEMVLVLKLTGKVLLNNTPKSKTGMPLSALAYQLNQQALNPYVFDETGYTGSAELNLNITNLSDIVTIRKTLKVYGLELREEERVVDKFVFSETK